MPVLQLRREMLPRVISGEVHNMRIPVMDKNRVPLMPCTSARARKLLNQGKASAYWNKLGIFCIILNKEVEPNNQKLVVGIDPGSKFEGWSVVGTEDTVLNGMSETPIHIKKAVEVRRNMRRARRHRNLWRREARFNNRLRNKDSLPPSTLSRWQAKYRILEQLLKVLPISDVVVEDVNAATKNGSKKWNLNFSPIQHGKNWLYSKIEEMGLKLHLRQGYETKQLRDDFKLKKLSQKDKKTFSSHAVDAWVMAASVSGSTKPSWTGLFYWIPIRLHRRQLHRFEPGDGGIRTSYGGTRSMGLTRGTLVKHIKFGLVYIGGTQKNGVSLHSIVTGKRLTQNAKVSDLKILTTLHWRAWLLPTLKNGVSAAHT